MTGRARLALAAYGVLAAVHVAAQLTETTRLATATQVLLMPLLAVALVLLAPLPSRLVRLTLVALGCSWLGDTVPRFLDGDPEFLAMVGCFLLAQATYVVAFRPYAAASLLAVHRRWLAAYLLPVAVLLAVCLPGAGVLAPAVIVYGGLLLAMALLATGVHPLAWAGGAVFAVSDGLIAIGAFGPRDVPEAPGSAAVMSTYALAQLLIVLGVTAAAADPARSPSSSGRGSRSAPAAAAGTPSRAARRP
jgi:uncharacterized membrane protein YhhN